MTAVVIREPDGTPIAVAVDVAAATMIRAALIEIGHECWIDYYTGGDPMAVLLDS